MENKYVKTNFGFGKELTVAIKRDGVDIELTMEEVVEIFEIMRTHEDMALLSWELDALVSNGDDEYINYFTPADVKDKHLLYEITKNLSSKLVHNDAYWDEYYNELHEEIHKYMKNNPRN